ncbi:hypothetical protein J437_LFUL018423 [Ladona fulva]|uniref:Uncharacterized protein n=1 Tax=Ladona fulva TaxID=123851 RepID=A0A8K0KRH8_LADFU|nr:hypothetical protein J437_LFUL018423 [Ladona fulva]
MDRKRKLLEEDIEQELLADSDSDAYNSDVSDDSDEGDSGGICFSYMLWALSNNFALFVLARFVGGISKGNVSLSMAIMTDVSSQASRAKGMRILKKDTKRESNYSGTLVNDGLS